jgi:hypothetical protein
MASALALFELNTRSAPLRDVSPFLSCSGARRKSHSEIPHPPTAPELRFWSITYSSALRAIGDGLDRSSG